MNGGKYMFCKLKHAVFLIIVYAVFSNIIIKTIFHNDKVFMFYDIQANFISIYSYICTKIRLEKIRDIDFMLAHVVGIKVWSPAKIENSSIAVCYGVVYGENVVIDKLMFFVQYYNSIGVDKVVAYVHPNQKLLYDKLVQVWGLDVHMWRVNYLINKKNHRENHKDALKKCLTDLKRAHYGWVIICDTDEFLYFNRQKYKSLRTFLSSNGSPVKFEVLRRYYQIDLCQTPRLSPNDSNNTIWKHPYYSDDIMLQPMPPKTIAALQYLTNKSWPESQFEHFFPQFQGSTVTPDVSDVHFKHYRRFTTTNTTCTRMCRYDTCLYREAMDKNDPAQKSSFSYWTHRYILDKKLDHWRQYVYGGNKLPPTRAITHRTHLR